MREGWQEIGALCGKMTDPEEGHMVGSLLSVLSNVCRMEPTQVVHLCCGLGDDCVVVVIDKIEMEPREVCSLPDDYKIMKEELNNKRQDVEDLEEDVKELKTTVAKLEEEVRFQNKIREEDKKNSGTKRVDFWGPCW